MGGGEVTVDRKALTIDHLFRDGDLSLQSVAAQSFCNCAPSESPRMT